MQKKKKKIHVNTIQLKLLAPNNIFLESSTVQKNPVPAQNIFW